MCIHAGFPRGSAGKGCTCNAGDPSSIPGLGRSAREGIGYSLQYSWASLMAQLVKKSTCNAGYDPWVGKIPWRRERLTTPVFWPGEFQGLYSSWGHRESDMAGAAFTFMHPGYSLHLSHPPPLLPHPCPYVCSLCPHLRCCSANRFVSTILLGSIIYALIYCWCFSFWLTSLCIIGSRFIHLIRTDSDASSSPILNSSFYRGTHWGLGKWGQPLS